MSRGLYTRAECVEHLENSTYYHPLLSAAVGYVEKKSSVNFVRVFDTCTDLELLMLARVVMHLQVTAPVTTSPEPELRALCCSMCESLSPPKLSMLLSVMEAKSANIYHEIGKADAEVLRTLLAHCQAFEAVKK